VAAPPPAGDHSHRQRAGAGLRPGPRRPAVRPHNPPRPADVGLVVEIANGSLDRDRLDKGRIYARAGIPVYWVVNLIDRAVEVYSAPSGPTPSPAYGRKDEYRSGDQVPVALGGSAVGAVPVGELLPEGKNRSTVPPSRPDPPRHSPGSRQQFPQAHVLLIDRPSGPVIR